jgi:hypothetical protein
VPLPRKWNNVYSSERKLTILRDRSSPATDPEALALSALGWVLGDDARASRLLALTGLTPDALREGLGQKQVLAAILDFLCAHEPDLLAAAEALGVEPLEIAAARERLGS